MTKSILLFLVALLVLGCEDEATVITPTIDRCNILQSLEELTELVDECNENRLSSTSEIKDNLIGNWILSGIGYAWTDFEATSDCLLLSISEDSLVLKDLNTNEDFFSTWELRSSDANDQFFFLEPNDQELIRLVGMDCFSDNIMFGAGQAIDTDTYVYVKVN